MKKIFYGFLSFFVLAGVMSCKKFLDKKPLSQGYNTGGAGSDSLLLKTAADAENAIRSVYSEMKNGSGELYFLDYYVNGDAQSDNAYAGGDNPANFAIDKFIIDATNSNVSRDWGHYYTLISNCNNVLNNVPKVTDPGLSAARKNEIIGEASFLRAFFYFDLVRLWGDVPLVLKQVTSISSSNLPQIYPLLYPARTTKDSIYLQIIADLQTAISQAPANSGPTKFIGTKGAANALMAKVYATILPHDWNKVKQYCDAVIAAGYSLLPNYDYLWDGAHENSAEAIFEIDCTDWGTGGDWGPFIILGTDWKKFNTPTNDLVNLFNAEGDNVRKNSSITFADVTGFWTDTYWPAANYPFINKYRDFSGGQNQILIRLADIILLKAEALIELNDLTTAKTLINQIRSRVGLANTTATTQSDLRLAVEKERRLELAFEGIRWYDLVRTGRAIPVMNAQKDGNGASLGYNLTQNKLLWPIPQAERDKNVNLTQNPGY